MKKALAIVLVMALLCIISVGGTLSYFTDTDGAANTMTVGKVSIVQNEQYRVDGGFADWHPADGEAYVPKLLPAVILTVENNMIPKDAQTGLWLDAAINNEIDKIVTVTVDADSEDAYIRTIFAFETGMIYQEGTNEVYGYIHDIYLGVNGTMKFLENNDGTPVIITIDDTQYAIAVCTYENPVEAGKTTESSLRQFFLSPNAGNEFFDLIDGSYEILVLSQAVQSKGFETQGATAALDAAFGAVDATNAAGWFAEVNN